MSQIFRQNAGKKIKSVFEVFIQQKIEFKFVLFSIGQTLGGVYARVVQIILWFGKQSQFLNHFGGV